MRQVYQLMPGAEGSMDMYYSGNDQDNSASSTAIKAALPLAKLVWPKAKLLRLKSEI